MLMVLHVCDASTMLLIMLVSYRRISGGSVSYFHMLWGDLGRFGLYTAHILLESLIFSPKLKVGNIREKAGVV